MTTENEVWTAGWQVGRQKGYQDAIYALGRGAGYAGATTLEQAIASLRIGYARGAMERAEVGTRLGTASAEALPRRTAREILAAQADWLTVDVQTLAERLGMSVDVVRQVRKRLKDAGLVEVHRV